MIHKVVLGLIFGDEGKGRTVDYLCGKSKNPLVVRFEGGQQAGHTAFYKGIKHEFANFGAGTLRGIPTYWMPTCTIDPIGIYNEFYVLQEKDVKPVLYIDPACPVTTPYDIQMNLWVEHENKHGSCGVGVGTTLQREENRYHLLYRDLFYPEIFKIKLEMIKRYYGHEVGKAMRNEDLREFMDCVAFIVDNKNIRTGKPDFNENEIETCIYEGAQGLLLDQNFGFFPHVTRGNTGLENIKHLLKNPVIYLVTRAYQTRHGNGPMTNVEFVHTIKNDPNEVNINNEKQGKFRKTLLDLNLLQYAIEAANLPKDKCILVVNLLNHIKDYELTLNNIKIICKDENAFIEQIKSYLKIENVVTFR